MKIRNHHIVSHVVEKIKTVEFLIKDSPIIIMSHPEDFWVSEKAEKKLLERNIDADEFMKWLKVGVKHFCETSYSGLYACMIPLPGKILGEEVLIILCDQLCERKKKKLPLLTSMEKRVIKHLARGLSNKEIASNLEISAGTVNAYLDSIYRKLGVSNRLQATCTAVKHGIVVPAV